MEDMKSPALGSNHARPWHSNSNRRFLFRAWKAGALLALGLGLAASGRAQSTASTVVTGALTVPGQRDTYVFQVSAKSRFYFDALTNVYALEWSLSGPAGPVVQDRPFTSSDAESIGDPTVLLPAGSYALTVRSSNDTTNGYAFRFINLADATLLTPGTVVSNALAPATKTDLYQFTAAAGDRYFFHEISRTSLPNTWWRLMDPYGNQLFSRGLSDVGSASAPTALTAAGTYTLMVEGYIGDPGSGAYSIEVVPEGNVPPAPFTGTPMNLGDLIVGNLAINTTNSYTFTLSAETRVVLDTQTNSPNLTWTLQGPSGLVVNRQGLNFSAGIYNFGPLDLPAGSYQLSLQATAAASPYQFRLLDLNSAIALTPGLALTNTLSPASSTALYRFNAAAGARFFFDSLAVNSLPNAAWRLVDPNNVVIFPGSVSSSEGPFSLGVGGVYTLLIEGYWGDPGSGSFGFNVAPVTDGLQALTLGSVVTGAISSPGQRQQYTFTLPASRPAVFRLAHQQQLSALVPRWAGGQRGQPSHVHRFRRANHRQPGVVFAGGRLHPHRNGLWRSCWGLSVPALRPCHRRRTHAGHAGYRRP